MLVAVDEFLELADKISHNGLDIRVGIEAIDRPITRDVVVRPTICNPNLYVTVVARRLGPHFVVHSIREGVS